MDRIYVTFSQPECADPGYFMDTDVWLQIMGVFPMAVLMVLLWPERRGARITAAYIAALIAIFGAGLLAGRWEMYGFLKLFPFQLANAIPALFLFIVTLALWDKLRVLSVPGQFAWALGCVVCIGLIVHGDVVTERVAKTAGRFSESLEWDNPMRYGNEVSDDELVLYGWIQEHTPKDSIFITPYLPAFWTYAERAQVASIRRPPRDRRMIEWHRRLEAINGGRPLVQRGFDIVDDFDANERRLTTKQLSELIRDYGATHYVVADPERRLPWPRVYADGGYAVYDLRQRLPSMTPEQGE
jgi:hypothetical protein